MFTVLGVNLKGRHVGFRHERAGENGLVRNPRNKDIMMSKKGEDFIFTVADGTAKSV